MNEFTLKMVYSPGDGTAPAAWLIPGEHARSWLDELTSWHVPLAPLRLFVIPHSAVDLRPRGLFAIVPRDVKPQTSGLCQPYTCRGEHLYLPQEARLVPELTDHELATCFRDQRQLLVFHPEAGLVGFEPEDAAGIQDLLGAPVSRHCSWDSAQPGTGFAKRLQSIEPDPESLPQIATLLDAGRDDIGFRSNQAGDLPRAPDEPADDWASRAMRGIGEKLARAMQGLSGGGTSAESAGTGSGSGRGLGAWSQRQLERIQESLAKLRHRSLLRLLHMLEQNPDEGLQYALPFGQSGHRGQSPPSAFLGRHDTQFDLTQLAGGRPADAWQLPSEYYHRLRQKYLELASREMRLGRYRRAAYIYGVLLGMLDLAASALMAGHHWREAAVLYRSRLGRPQDAAQCLEQGGLWSEAIQLHEELENWERAGDLYRKLDQSEAAVRCYRLAVDRLAAQQDWLAAARLLESKLDTPGEALERLDRAWPEAAQGRLCLRESFQLIARLNRHEEMLQRIHGLRNSILNDERMTIVAEELAQVATDYPHLPVRPLAADAVRAIAASRLRGASMNHRELFVHSVRRLVPEDRLLTRDCQRYLETHRRPGPGATKRPSATAKVQSSSSGREPILVSEFVLPPHPPGWTKAGAWRAARTAGGRLYLAGSANLEHREYVIAAECDWENHHRWLGEPRLWGNFASLGPMMFAARAGERLEILIAVLGHKLLVQQVAAQDAFPEELEAGTPSWLPATAISVTSDRDGNAWVIEYRQNQLMLHAFSPDGTPRGSHTIQALLPQESELNVPLEIAENVVCAGIGEQLFVLDRDGRQQYLSLDSQIYEIATSPAHSVPRAVVSLFEGAAFCWLDRQEVRRFATSLYQPTVAFLAGGWVVLADNRQGQVYRAARDGVHLESTFTVDEQRPLAIVATGSMHEFALVYAQGLIRRYRMAVAK